VSSVSLERLHRSWVHSHEEDSEDEMVFRPAEFELPPSRGRMGFELRADGTVAESAIGPTDRPQENVGTWTLEGDDKLVLSEGAGTVVPRVMPIVSAEDDRLVVLR
jgi:hypothetical protein